MVRAIAPDAVLSGLGRCYAGDKKRAGKSLQFPPGRCRSGIFVGDHHGETSSRSRWPGWNRPPAFRRCGIPSDGRLSKLSASIVAFNPCEPLLLVDRPGESGVLGADHRQ